ncbi:MAG: hypothetical protein R3Y35_06495 [Clostridia bacterium]
MRELKNNRIQVTFAGENDYTAARFDWCGIIREVTLDGKFTFGSSEKPKQEPRTTLMGLGLCSEFGLEQPLGLDENLDYLMKIGVGEVVRNPDKTSKHTYIRKNPDLCPNIKSKFTDDTATFTLAQSSDNGYAYEYEKKIVIIDNTIEIYTTLKNVGEKFIDTKEYFHNFVNLNDMPVDENYVMTVNQIPENWEKAFVGEIEVEGKTFSFPEKVSHVFYARANETNSMTKWTLSHKNSNISMSETTDTPATRFATWGLGHVYSCELFTDVKIATGETYNNKRTFKFDC